MAVGLFFSRMTSGNNHKQQAYAYFSMFVRKTNKYMLILQYSIGTFTVFVDDLPITLETAVGLFSRLTSCNNHRKK